MENLRKEIIELIKEIKCENIEINIINDDVYLTGAPIYMSAIDMVYFIHLIEKKYNIIFERDELLKGNVNSLAYIFKKINNNSLIYYDNLEML